ncbi:MAG TPA: adenylate/guanylate cyclase domain-containing protein [Vicinamibacteria bacterium]|nr:adenylate/guanylate cyclase domain-containing protein [Vicinamibacteria bacterium]
MNGERRFNFIPWKGMYRLTYQEGDTTQTHTFTSGEVIMGRSPECQLVLKDFGISRQHAKIVVDDDGVRVVDLKSKNGTQVNGVPVVEAHLKDGDRILLAKFQITFNKTLEGKVVLDEAKPLSEEGGTIIRSVGELSKLLSPVETPKAAVPGAKKADVQEIEKSNRILKILTEVAKTLIAVRPVEEVLEQVMDIVFDHIAADRGFLMLNDEATGKLIPKVIRHRNALPGADPGQITISKTIADRVVRERVAILTSDALVDPRFESGQSIHFHGIRSAICAPLWNQDQVIGIIHMDSNMRTNIFDLNDLDLLTALANYAAVAIERSRLNQRILAEEKKRERLGRFLSPQVANRILQTSESSSAALGVPEAKEVSILFADIVGFTTMSERMSPAAVALLLNDYLSRMTDVIFQYEGTLDKYIGDAIMAVFGAPLDMPDHAYRCIRAALDMRERLEEFNAERKEGPQLRIRIGINSGKAVACEIGSINKKEYTVLGDVVNTASRLESSVATPMTIVIGENTFDAVTDLFECTNLGAKPLKGKEKVVVAYEVLRYLGGGPPGPEGSTAEGA